MKRFTLLVALAVTAGFAEHASAQAFPMWRKAMSPAEVAEAIDDRDDTRLVATPEQILAAIQQSLPDAHVEDVSGLVAYLRNLEIRPCPRGEHQLSRILKGKLDWDFRRRFGSDEPCFFDRNLNRFVLSARCGNVVWYGLSSQTTPASAIPVYVNQTMYFVSADTSTSPTRQAEEALAEAIAPKKGGGWKKPAFITAGIGAAVAGAIYYFAARGRGDADKPLPAPGGLVNPPNRSFRIPIGW